MAGEAKGGDRKSTLKKSDHANSQRGVEKRSENRGTGSHQPRATQHLRWNGITWNLNEHALLSAGDGASVGRPTGGTQLRAGNADPIHIRHCSLHMVWAAQRACPAAAARSHVSRMPFVSGIYAITMSHSLDGLVAWTAQNSNTKGHPA